VDIAVSKLNGDALSQANMDHLKETFDNLSKASASLSESSEKIGAVVEKAGGTMGSAQEAAEKIQGVAGDAQKTVQAATRILNEATKGDGLVPLLLTNQAVAEDLRALISNLRRHGVLFYRDSAAKIAPPPQNTPAPRRPRSNR
jgi:ABC-type transporter Mla subunit MlaD